MKRIMNQLRRNKLSINDTHVEKNRIHLEYWSQKVNLGDALAPVIYEWMLQKNGLDAAKKTKKTIHLLTVGSLLGMGNFDAVVWGTGFHTFGSIRSIVNKRIYRKYDVRAVRGPFSAEVLKMSGYACSEVYGDPAILMPLIYQPQTQPKKFRYSAILHQDHKNVPLPEDMHYIDITTDDYQSAITQIVQSERVISSSLHGIILAEAYGVPAVFLGNDMQYEVIKFYDWYYSTNRKNVLIANSVDESVQMIPMPLPELGQMQKMLIEAFPVDLWNN